MDKWEYKVCHYHEDWACHYLEDYTGKVSFEDYLNWHQDWELVTIIPIIEDPKVIDCIFKRKIQ